MSSTQSKKGVMAASSDKLARAWRSYRDGDVGKAKALALNIVRKLPRNASAHHLLGMLAATEREMHSAAGYFRKAVDLKPDLEDALFNLGVVLNQIGECEEAVFYYKKALLLNNLRAGAHKNLVLSLLALDRVQDALERCRTAIDFLPTAQMYDLEAEVLKQSGLYTEAIESHGLAVSLQSSEADYHYNFGLTLMAVERFDDALAEFEEAIRNQFDHAAAYLNRGVALQRLNRHEEALKMYDAAIRIDSGYVEAYDNRGIALNQLGRHLDAVNSYDRAIELRPTSPLLWNKRGISLSEMQNYCDAIKCHEMALRLDESDADAYNEIGANLTKLGKFNESLISYEAAIDLNEAYADAHFNRGYLLLLLGRFLEGWPEYEWRKTLLKVSRPIRGETWTGTQSLRGKTILIYAEQGLGDIFQFCRYVRVIERIGARVIMQCPFRLHSLIRSAGEEFILISDCSEVSHFDFHCSVMSLPFALGTQAESIPSMVPYLIADPARVLEWKKRLGEGFKVGVCWQGDKGRIDVGRSFHVSEFQAFSHIPEIRLISLQKGDGIEQLQDPSQKLNIEVPGHDVDGGKDAFIDTAVIMMSLDLVISSDTAVAHLAGALGRRTWLALKRVPDWRWQLDRDDSPWYPTMQLFRQPVAGDWGSLFAEMAETLAQELRGSHENGEKR
jgi:tetratricopeptide (TPR) repeat protein